MEDYTREAGVRELERQIGSVCRGIAAQVAQWPVNEKAKVEDKGKGVGKAKGDGEANVPGETSTQDLIHGNGKTQVKPVVNTNSKLKLEPGQPCVVTPKVVRGILGPERYDRQLDTRLSQAGVVVGLAYTPVGGEILFIEATSYAGKGNIMLTGQIGDVMKESANAALSLCKSRAGKHGWTDETFSKRDLHIHVPAGAVPKDGPSAGVAMFTALVSLLSGVKVKPGLAMTGEITLRGLVLPIGGVKEKTLAAARAGIRTVILPKRNQRDMEEVDAKVKKALKFIFVENVDELLHHALGRPV
ncbi:MAG: hypothetical protein HC898_07845 [Phycisphaerales bacterium]|nr:hypothetical protein [Phycisphaerales bacterium]